jgi:AcrR family transcriptional regulator
MSTYDSDGAHSYHHGKLRTALVNEALRRLEAGEENALGLREVARAAGVSPAAPYRHFKNRAALMESVATIGFRRLKNTVLAAAETTPLPGRLQAMGLAYVRFALYHTHLFRLMFSSELDKRSNAELAAASDSAFAPLIEEAERVGGRSSQELALASWAFVHGLSSLLLDRQILSQDTAGAEALAERLLTGFGISPLRGFERG